MRTTASFICILVGGCSGLSQVEAGLDLWGDEKNRIGINGTLLFNVKFDMESLGEIPSATAIGSSTGDANRYYDDGFNLIDAGGNADASTFYWGYDNSSQVTDNTVRMNSAYSEGGGVSDEFTDDPHWGFEVRYARELGWSSSYWWGVVTAVGWQQLTAMEEVDWVAGASQVSDDYTLVSGSFPAAPYRGTASGPGPRITSVPDRQTTVFPGQAVGTGMYHLDASLITFRLGLLFETSFGRTLDLQFGGGAMAGWIRGDLDYTESISLLGDESRFLSGSETSEDFVGGGYAEAALSFHFTRHWGARVGGRYLFLTDASFETHGRRMNISFEHSVQALIGLNYAF